MRSLIFALFTVASFHTTYAAVLCQYAAYTPASLRYSLVAKLGSHGVAVVPASYFPIEAKSAPGESLVVRNGVQYGWFRFRENRRVGTSSLTFSDNNRTRIAVAEEIATPCPGGICNESRFTIWLGGKPSTLGIRESSKYGVRYYVGDKIQENVTVWRSEFSESVRWLLRMLIDETHGISIPAYSKSQAFAVLLASDLEVSPYLPFLKLGMDSRGSLFFSGRLNQQIYDRIIMLAIRNGFYDIHPYVIIDSAAVIVPYPKEEWLRCL
jgi:hypothetical protein